MIRIQNQPITFPGNAEWLPNPCAIATIPQGFTVQDSVTGQFLSVQPDGSFQWIPQPRGVYEYFGLSGGFVTVDYVYGDEHTPISFRIPYFGV